MWLKILSPQNRCIRGEREREREKSPQCQGEGAGQEFQNGRVEAERDKYQGAHVLVQNAKCELHLGIIERISDPLDD
jgi:hypothetical protein